MLKRAPLSQRDRSLLALGLLAAVMWLVWAIVLSPLVEMQLDLSRKIEAARKQFGRVDAVLDRARPEAAPEPDQVETVWHGSSKSVIAANVQSLVQEAAAANGISIVSISQTESRFETGMETVGLIIEGYGEIAAFTGLLTALEQHGPILFVDHLMFRRYQNNSGPQPGERLPLAARFEVHAPYRLEEVSG